MIVNTSNSLLRQLFAVGFALYYMWSYNGLLLLLVLIPIPIIGVSLFFFTRRIRMVYRSIREATGQLSAKLAENITGIRVIKAFSREPIEHDLVYDTSKFLLDANLNASRMTSLFYPAIHVVSTAGTVVVLGVGAYLISKGQFTVGALTAFTMYVAQFYQPIGDFIRTFDSIQRALASGERIFEVLDTAPEIRDPDQPTPLTDVRGEVEFHDVSFRYATGDEVLCGVACPRAPRGSHRAGGAKRGRENEFRESDPAILRCHGRPGLCRWDRCARGDAAGSAPAHCHGAAGHLPI